MKKLSDDKKAILMYSGELIIFAILFLILGILKITKVFNYNETKRLIFNWITVFGCSWGFADFIWAICSKKRQKRVSMFDKIAVLPLSAYILVYDLISLIKRPSNNNFYIVMLSIAFFYISLIYIAMAIYHYYKPVPALLLAIEEERLEKEEKASSNKEDNN